MRYSTDLDSGSGHSGLAMVEGLIVIPILALLCLALVHFAHRARIAVTLERTVHQVTMIRVQNGPEGLLKRLSALATPNGGQCSRRGARRRKVVCDLGNGIHVSRQETIGHQPITAWVEHPDGSRLMQRTGARYDIWPQ